MVQFARLKPSRSGCLRRDARGQLPASAEPGRSCAYIKDSVATLHVTNGDSAASVLRTFLTDPVVIEADVLHEGPAPDVDDETWLDLRARFLADANDGDYAGIRASLARRSCSKCPSMSVAPCNYPVARPEARAS